MENTLSSLTHSAPINLGRNIAHNQPDVEVLAVLTKSLPTTLDAFDHARGDKDWLSMAVVIVEVGPPGFSSVPYTASKKKESIADLKALYVREQGLTTFYPFAKGKTNKDKGERVEWTQVNDTDTEVSATLKPGLQLSSFLRAETFSEGKFFVSVPEGCSTLPAGSFVYLQVASQNIDQALKGMLIKVKRVLPAPEMKLHCRESLGDILKKKAAEGFPSSMEEADQCTVNGQITISKCCAGSPLRVVATSTKREGFATFDTDKDVFVLVECHPDFDEIELSKSEALAVTGCAHVDRAGVMLNVAISAQALTLLLFHHPSSAAVAGSEASTVAVFAALHVETLLSLDNLMTGIATGHVGSPDFMLATASEGVAWHACNLPITTPQGKRGILFALGRSARYLSSPWNSQTYASLSDGAPGEFLPLSIFMTPLGITAPTLEVLAQEPTDASVDHCKRLLTLQLRTRTHGCGKRSRPTLDSENSQQFDYGQSVQGA